HQAALLVRAFESEALPANGALTATLELAGRALTAGTEEARSAERIARLLAEVTHAASCLLWRTEDGSATAIGSVGIAHGLQQLAEEGERELDGRNVVLRGADAETVAFVRRREPAVGGLRLAFSGVAPAPDELERLAAFGARAAHALRAGERTTTLGEGPERGRGGREGGG